MKNRLPKLFLLFVAIAAAASQVGAQGPPAWDTIPPETLTFEGKVTKLLATISIGDLTLSAKKAPNGTDLVVTTDAVSKGTLLKLFRFSFTEHYESTIDPMFRSLKTVKHDVQKDRVRDSEAIFDYGQHRVTYVESDPKSPNQPPRSIASDIGDSLLDMVAAIYYVRSVPLKVGQKLELQVSDSGLVYKVNVAVTGREMQKSILGNIMCWKLEPEIFGVAKLIDQKGKMTMWFADNPRKTPIRTSIQTQYGRIEIRLKTADPAK